jgi:hypothetical protein
MKKNIAESIKTLDTKALSSLWIDYKRSAELAKTMQEMVADEMRKRHASAVQEQLTLRGKQHGEVTMELDDTTVRFDIRSTVKWDSDVLRTIAATVPAELRESIFKVELSIPEKAYSGLSGELRSKVDEARTVIYSEPKVTFIGDQ